MVGILRLTVFSFYFGYWVKSPDALRSSVVLLSRYRVCVRSTPFSSFLRKLFSEKWTTTLAYRSFRLWAVRYGTPSSSAISLSFLAWMMICGRSLSFVRGIFYGISDTIAVWNLLRVSTFLFGLSRSAAAYFHASSLIAGSPRRSFMSRAACSSGVSGLFIMVFI